MTYLTVPTFTIQLFMSGPIEVAKQKIREVCYKGGFCCTITPTTFIYKGGEEAGFCVGLVDYPRYPVGANELAMQARDLAFKLLDVTHQHSVLLVGTNFTEWISKRESVPSNKDKIVEESRETPSF